MVRFFQVKMELITVDIEIKILVLDLLVGSIRTNLLDGGVEQLYQVGILFPDMILLRIYLPALRKFQGFECPLDERREHISVELPVMRIY